MNGVIIIDKPSGWTSHDVVARMRRVLKQRSIGHLGTLDPLATGVLPLVTGSFTRLAQFYTKAEKSYEGVIRFGFATDTYDADGDTVGEVSTINPSLEKLQAFAANFLGVIEQVPPPFSAKKINGVPAYKLARKQKEFILEPVQVAVKEFIITSVDADHAHFRARVSSGTYMRAIAHEMGRLLGCGGHLESLRRTAVAEFDITQAHSIDEIEACSLSNKSAGSISTCHSERAGANATASRRIPMLVETADGGRVENGLDGSDEPQGLKPKSVSALDGTTERRALPDIIRCGGFYNAGSKGSLLAELFVHPRNLLPEVPCVTADELTTARIRAGRPINLPELSHARQVKVFQGQSDLIAIATRVAGTLFHPKIVFPAAQQ